MLAGVFIWFTYAWMEAGKDCDLTEPNSLAKNLTFRHSKSSFFSKFCCFMSVKLI